MAEVFVCPKTKFVKDQVEASIKAKMQARQYNIGGGLSSASYDFTEFVYECTSAVINGTPREVWKIYDKDGKPVNAAAFFAHDELGVNFSGFNGTDLNALCEWLDGKILKKTERSASVWGPTFKDGVLQSRNADTGETRYYYES